MSKLPLQLRIDIDQRQVPSQLIYHSLTMNQDNPYSPGSLNKEDVSQLAAFLPTPPPEPIVAAAKATVYIPNPIHPLALDYACQRFGRVLVSWETTSPQPDLAADLDACNVLKQAPRQCNLERVEAQAAYPRAHGLLARQYTFGADLVQATDMLSAIAIAGVGYDNVDLSACKQRNVAVMNCPGGNASAVAELTLALTLALLRRIPELDNRLRSGDRLLAFDNLGHGLRGKHIGLVGMGSTARKVADIFFHAFACTIHVFSPTSPPTRWSAADPCGALPHTRHMDLSQMLAITDVLCLHCPLTSSTRSLISTAELNGMKRASVIVNMSRGAVVDEKALALALRSGVIAGAATDVFEVEPVSRDSANGLFEMRNFIGTPHITVEVQIDICVQAIDQLADYLDGIHVINRVC